MSERYCQHCHAELDSGAEVCSECGEQVRAPVAPDGGVKTARSDDTTLAVITHILGLFTWVVGPLVVLLVSDDEFVQENARNALNWQIILTVYTIVSALLMVVLVGVLLLALLGFLDLIFCIIAAVKASNGEAWKYPITPDIA